MISKKVAMKAAEKSRFGKLVAYLLDPQGKNTRVGEVSITNCVSSDTAWAVREITATQGLNARAISSLSQPTASDAPRRITRMNRNAPAFRRLRSSATKEQLREYFEVRFRAEKYSVPYFLAESEAKQSRPRKEAVGARARSGRGFKWRAPTRSVGRRPFKPQTALLHRRPPVGSEWIWRSQTS